MNNLSGCLQNQFISLQSPRPVWKACVGRCHSTHVFITCDHVHVHLSCSLVSHQHRVIRLPHSFRTAPLFDTFAVIWNANMRLLIKTAFICFAQIESNLPSSFLPGELANSSSREEVDEQSDNIKGAISADAAGSSDRIGNEVNLERSPPSG